MFVNRNFLLFMSLRQNFSLLLLYEKDEIKVFSTGYAFSFSSFSASNCSIGIGGGVVAMVQPIHIAIPKNPTTAKSSGAIIAQRIFSPAIL